MLVWIVGNRCRALGPLTLLTGQSGEGIDAIAAGAGRGGAALDEPSLVFTSSYSCDFGVAYALLRSRWLMDPGVAERNIDKAQHDSANLVLSGCL